MKKNDLISIIVPCYNCKDVVSRCLDSLINQTYKNIEIIVVDDGSKDDSKKIIKSYKNKNIYYYYKENGGLSSARNYGIKKSNGEYLLFVDSDDYVSNNYVEKLYNSIIDNKTNIAICDIKRVYSDHESINRMNNNIIDSCMYPAAWNKMYKKSLFKNIEFPEGKWYEDLGTTPKLTMNNKYSLVNEPLYYYVQNDKSIMHTFDDRIFDMYYIVEDLEKNDSGNNYDKLEFINVYHLLIGTVFRNSFIKKFKIKDIKKIHNYVKNKYPKWNKNKYAKSNLGFIFKTYLLCMHFHLYGIIYLILKLFNKKVSL